jgi:hypothetical protein
MRRIVRSSLLLALGAAVLAVAGGPKKRERVLRLLGRDPRRVPDRALRSKVLRRLGRLTDDAAGLTVTIEHGCVTLCGPVRTDERAKIVREIAKHDGVDSVIDLMTEPIGRGGAAPPDPARPSRRDHTRAVW